MEEWNSYVLHGSLLRCVWLYECLHAISPCTNVRSSFDMRARRLNCDWICLGCSSNNAHLLVNYLSFPLHVPHSRIFHSHLLASRSQHCALRWHVSHIHPTNPVPSAVYTFHILYIHTYSVHVVSLSMWGHIQHEFSVYMQWYLVHHKYTAVHAPNAGGNRSNTHKKTEHTQLSRLILCPSDVYFQTWRKDKFAKIKLN